MILLPFKTEFILTPRSPEEVRDALAQRTGPYPGLFKSTKALFSGPVDCNGFALKLQGIGRGPVVVVEGTISEIPQGGGSMIRLHYRLSWISFFLWLWVMVPICAMNWMILPDAISKARTSIVLLPLFFLVFGYGFAMLPFSFQRKRLADAIGAATN